MVCLRYSSYCFIEITTIFDITIMKKRETINKIIKTFYRSSVNASLCYLGGDMLFFFLQAR